MFAAALVIVMLKVPSGKTAAIAAAQESVLQQLAPSESTLIARWHNVPGFAALIEPEAIERLKGDPLVERVDADVGGSGSDAESLPLIGGDKVHLAGYTGRGVTVAVLDTGIDESHPDFEGRIAGEACFCRNADGTGCCPNGQMTQLGPGAAADDHGHGSNVAGIIGSGGVVAPAGVAPGVSFVVVKVLDSNSRFSSTAQIVSALDWLIDNHPEVRAINMSLGTDALFPGDCDSTASFTSAFASAIDTLRGGGALTFVSSGNDASAVSMEAPACVHDAVSVGAVYDSNVGRLTFHCTDATSQADQITCFSNSDSTLDLLAPGAIITSDWLRGGTSNFYGTSQAAPHATGSAAVLASIDPSLAPDDIESLLKRTGKLIADPRNGVVTPRIDLWLAVSALLPPPPRHRAAEH